MTEVERLEREVVEIREQLRPLEERLVKASRCLQTARSKAFIAKNKITIQEVELSDREDVSWFGTVWKFGEYLKSKPDRKPWCEWNTIIYRTDDVVAGRLPNSVALLCDVPRSVSGG